MTLGQFLQKIRQERGLELPQVAQTLRLRVQVLQAIEDDAGPGSLVPSLYWGFVRSYARYLKVDKTPEFQELLAQAKSQVKPVEGVKKLEIPQASRTIRWTWIWGLGFMVLFGYFLWQTYGSSDSQKAEMFTKNPVPQANPKPSFKVSHDMTGNSGNFLKDTQVPSSTPQTGDPAISVLPSGEKSQVHGDSLSFETSQKEILGPEPTVTPSGATRNNGESPLSSVYMVVLPKSALKLELQDQRRSQVTFEMVPEHAYLVEVHPPAKVWGIQSQNAEVIWDARRLSPQADGSIHIQ